MTGFSEEQLAALHAPLAREHIKTREQGGRDVSYIEGWHAIVEANRIFGFDGWDRETSMSCVTEKETLIGRPPRNDRDPPQREGWRVAYVGKVRITVRAGDTLVVREGSGYGSGIDVDLGAAHESAAKECETDCLKRSLMTFGNPFGLALYDKAQAGVEARAPATRPQAPQKPASAPLYPPTANGGPPSMPSQGPSAGTEEQQLTLSQIRDRIIEELPTKLTEAALDAYERSCEWDLIAIEKAHRPTGQRLRDLFAGYRREVLGS